MSAYYLCYHSGSVDEASGCNKTSGEKHLAFLINKVFQLCYLENRGAAFGLLQNQRIFFLICALVILIFAIWIYGKLPNAQRYLPLRICIIGICGAGAIGNMIDRIYLGYVVDFFYFNLIDFPIFNVADINVTVFNYDRISNFDLILLSGGRI